MDKVNEISKKGSSQMQSALKVSDRIQLESVRLKNCSCEQKYLVGPGPKSYDISRNAESKLDETQHKVFVTTEFNLKMYDSENENRKEFVSIKASFLLIYSIDTLEGITEEDVDMFGHANGVFNAWPYWREYVQSMTTRMNLPPLTIPVYRISFPTAKAATAKKTAVEKKSK